MIFTNSHYLSFSDDSLTQTWQWFVSNNLIQNSEGQFTLACLFQTFVQRLKTNTKRIYKFFSVIHGWSCYLYSVQIIRIPTSTQNKTNRRECTAKCYKMNFVVLLVKQMPMKGRYPKNTESFKVEFLMWYTYMQSHFLFFLWNFKNWYMNDKDWVINSLGWKTKVPFNSNGWIMMGILHHTKLNQS